MYGSRFADLWSSVDRDEVKSTWAEALGRFDGETLKRAIDLCLKTYDHPPTLPQFFNLCKAQPRPELLKLDAPRIPMPEHVKQQLAKFRNKHVMAFASGKE